MPTMTVPPSSVRRCRILNQAGDIMRMEANRRLLQNVDCRFASPAGLNFLCGRGRRGESAEVTSLMRCASPPLRVGLGWPSCRYPNPVSASKIESSPDFREGREELQEPVQRSFP